MMQNKILKSFLVLTIPEAILTLAYLLLIPIDPNRGQLINYQVVGIMLGILLIAFILTLIWLSFQVLRKPEWSQLFYDFLEKKILKDERLIFKSRFALILSLICLLEGFLLTFFFFPVPFRPLFVLAFLICLQIWLGLHLVFSKKFQKRSSIFLKIKSVWLNWDKTQRRVFITLSILSLIYFCIFIPINASGRMHADEVVVLPDVINMFIPGETFTETMSDIFIQDNWWYGYPYFPISALAILPSRLIFGNQFVEQTQLNLLLLRQLISVLPMIFSILLLTYLVTRFRNAWLATSMFVVLALIPGVVRYNMRFWHPDSIITLLAILTIFFLQRDRFKFGKNFYLAAFMCGLMIAIKLWGLYFFLAIGGYLLAGLWRKVFSFWKMIRAGLLFVLVMVSTVIISSPSVLIPWVSQAGIEEMQEYYPIMREGYDEPDPQGVYRTGLSAWMPFFEAHYMQEYFFWFSCFALTLGSLIGSQVSLNRFLLSWCLVVGVYLVAFIAVKSFQYMLPVMVPFYAGAFLLPAISEGAQYPGWLSFLQTPRTKKIIWILMGLMIFSQFIFNLILITESPKY